MITFFRKLFKRGDFMTRADKWYYTKVFSTIFWSSFSLLIIAWVGTNLVLCALSTGAKSSFDIIYSPPHAVTLPTGKELAKAIKNTASYDTSDTTVKTITFDTTSAFSGGGYGDIFEGVTPEIINEDDDIKLYRLNGGADVYILSNNYMHANPDSSCSFYNCRGVTQINFNNYTFGEEVNNASSMFYYCNALTSVDVSGFNTKNVTNFSQFLYSCSGLKEVNTLHLSLSKATNLKEMYAHCSGATTFKTPAVQYSATNISGMFRGCAKLSSIDVTYWNTSYVTNMSYLFCGCKALKTITGKPNTSNVKDFSGLFEECTSFTNIDLSSWNTSSLGVGVGNGTNDMFRDCTNLISVNLSGWNMKNISTSSAMFCGCTKLTTIQGIENWSMSSLETAPSMFSGCSSLKTLDLSGWNTAKLRSCGQMFSGCRNLTTIFVSSKFVTTSVLYSNTMFSTCSKLVGGAGTAWSSSNPTDVTYARVDDPENGKPGYFTLK